MSRSRSCSVALAALGLPLTAGWRSTCCSARSQTGRLFVQVVHENGIRADSASTRGQLGRVVAMLRHGDVAAAVEAAIAAYSSAGVALADFDVFPEGPDPHRLLAALTIPARAERVLAAFRRWRAPTNPGNHEGEYL